MLALTYITYAGIYFARKNFAVVKHTLTQDSSVSFTSGGINGVETAFLFA
jgi:sugar phosphate permease